MRQVLRDRELEDQFQRDGYVPIDFLGESDIRELKLLIKQLEEDKKSSNVNQESSYKLSFFNSSEAYRKHVFQTVNNFFIVKVNKFLFDYKSLIINIFDKEPGTGEVPVHQNWTFVDETKYSSVSVWIPLQDVTHMNGTLEVVPGSHRNVTKFRSPTIPWAFNDLFDELREKYLLPLNLKLGQAAIIDDAIIHWSSENKMTEPRSAIQLIMTPNEAPPIHYYYQPEKKPGKLEVFQVNSDFFTSFDMNEKPQGVRSLGLIDFEPVHLNEMELVRRVAINDPAIEERYDAFQKYKS